MATRPSSIHPTPSASAPVRSVAYARAGVSDQFPDEAMRVLIRVGVAIDVLLVLVGMAAVVSGSVAGGTVVVAMGVAALLAGAIVMPPRIDRRDEGGLADDGPRSH